MAGYITERDMDHSFESLKKSLFNFFLMFILILIGLGFFWIAEHYFNQTDSVVFITAIFIPFIFYLVLSGVIKELKTPGGLEIKINESAKSMISKSSIVNLIELPISIIKEGMPDLYNADKQANPFRPLILKIILPGRDYNYLIMKEYARILSKYPNFKFVAFLEENEKFICFMPSFTFFNLLTQNEQLGKSFIEVLNSPEKDSIKVFSGVFSNVVRTNTSNIAALKRMAANNLDSSIVINSERKIVGIVTKERIIADIIIRLID